MAESSDAPDAGDAAMACMETQEEFLQFVDSQTRISRKLSRAFFSPPGAAAPSTSALEESSPSSSSPASSREPCASALVPRLGIFNTNFKPAIRFHAQPQEAAFQVLQATPLDVAEPNAPDENNLPVGLAKLANSGNAPFDKLARALVHLATSAKALKKRTTRAASARSKQASSSDVEDAESAFLGARALEAAVALEASHAGAAALATNLAEQLAALYGPKCARAYAALAKAPLYATFEALGEAILALAEIDATCGACPSASSSLASLERALEHDGVQDDAPRAFVRSKAHALDATAARCRASLADTAKRLVDSRANVMTERLGEYVTLQLTALLERVGTAGEHPADARLVVATLALAAQHAWVACVGLTSSKRSAYAGAKLNRLAWELVARIPVAHIARGVCVETAVCFAGWHPPGAPLAHPKAGSALPPHPVLDQAGYKKRLVAWLEAPAAERRLRHALSSLGLHLSRQGGHGSDTVPAGGSSAAALAGARDDASASSRALIGSALNALLGVCQCAAKAQAASAVLVRAHELSGAAMPKARARLLVHSAAIVGSASDYLTARQASAAAALPNVYALAFERLARWLAPVARTLKSKVRASSASGRFDADAAVDAAAAAHFALNCAQGPPVAVRTAALALALDCLSNAGSLPTDARASCREVLRVAVDAAAFGETASVIATSASWFRTRSLMKIACEDAREAIGPRGTLAASASARWGHDASSYTMLGLHTDNDAGDGDGELAVRVGYHRAHEEASAMIMRDIADPLVSRAENAVRLSAHHNAGSHVYSVADAVAAVTSSTSSGGAKDRWRRASDAGRASMSAAHVPASPSALLGTPRLIGSASVALTTRSLPQPRGDGSLCLRLGGNVVSLRSYTHDKLSDRFHAHAAVALTDWRAYGRMALLASRRAGLDAAVPDLPPTDHDQGLDVLEVMRNVHVFCARYGYSLSGQCFLERLPASGKFERKHAHCMSPRHVNLSIRQHGTGIIATAINGCYRYLGKKISILSAFLYDDHVRSRLARELKHAEEALQRQGYKATLGPRDRRSGSSGGGFQSRYRSPFERRLTLAGRDGPKKGGPSSSSSSDADAAEQTYPYARADEFVREIRKLGVSRDGSSYLDRCRRLITEIGNCLGFVRLVRLGMARRSASAAALARSAKRMQATRGGAADKSAATTTTTTTTGIDTAFRQAAEDAGLGASVVDAAGLLDAAAAELSSDAGGGANYLQLLTQAFMGELRENEANAHFRSFYALVPALCVSAADAMVASRAAISRWRVGTTAGGLSAGSCG
ncbi:WASH complex subunit 7 [Pycnococcus provasolii]